MQILLFTDPMIWRDSPNHSAIHIPWFKKILTNLSVQSSDTVFVFGNAQVCHFMESELAETCEARVTGLTVSPAAILEEVDGSIHDYSRDLFQSPFDPVGNLHLSSAVRDAFHQATPDLALATQQNRYVAAHCPAETNLFFMEAAPLPAALRRNMVYLDPIAHNFQNTIATNWTKIVRGDFSQDDGLGKTLLARFDQALKTSSQDPELVGVRSRLKTGAPPVMVALQPPDWITWEGAQSGRYRPLDLCCQVASKLPGHTILPTFHKQQNARAGVLAALATMHPNIFVGLADTVTAKSEGLLDLVEGVFCVTSAVGMSAILAGKTIISDARSQYGPMQVSPADFANGKRTALSRPQRENLIEYLMRHYCKELDSFRDLDAFKAHQDTLLSGQSKLAAPNLIEARGERKIAVLDFGYKIYTNFETDCDTTGRFSVNLGDYVQSVGAYRALRSIGVADEDIVRMDRDTLHQYDGPPVRLLTNAVFTPSNFPQSEALHPIYFGLSYHFNNILKMDSREALENSLIPLRGLRVGCRDRSTAELLGQHGIETYVSGCLSQSLSRSSLANRSRLPELICGVQSPDVEDQLKMQFPDHVRLKDQRRFFQNFPLRTRDREECWDAAERLLDFYDNSFSLCLTSLLHCASPCAAMGIPTVLLRRDPGNLRFTDLSGDLPVLHAPDAASIPGAEVLRNMAKTLDRREAILRNLRKAITT